MQLVEEEPLKVRTRLYGYGVRAVARLAGVSEKTVSRAAKAGELDLGRLGSVVAWCGRKHDGNRTDSVGELP
jgi:hypothetical protein